MRFLLYAMTSGEKPAAPPARARRRARPGAGPSGAAPRPELPAEVLAALVADISELVEAGRRRLLRYSFDLHDGALQHVAALLGDVRLFRSQLRASVRDHPDADRLLGRVDDLEARLVDVERELRALARSSAGVRSPALGEALRRQVEAFAAGTEMRPTLSLRGDPDRLPRSQQDALRRIAEAALANVRAHSGATEVELAVAVSDEGAELVVRDDGRGFDVEEALTRTAGERLGLRSMRERAALLGGRMSLRSAPGRTEVRVYLPSAAPPDVPSGAPRRGSRS